MSGSLQEAPTFPSPSPRDRRGTICSAGGRRLAGPPSSSLIEPKDNTVRSSSRIVLAVSALALVAGFFLPLWSISLEAPQYPEGIGLQIRVNTITGTKPHDLDNINKLNHYIGMKSIEPDAIPELELMPWVLGFLVLAGLAAAALGRRWMLFAWLALLAAVGCGRDGGLLAMGVRLRPQPGSDGRHQGARHDLSTPAHRIQSSPELRGPLLAGSWRADRDRSRVLTGLAGWWRASQGQAGKGPAGCRTPSRVGAAPLSGCGPKGPVPVTVGEDSCAECLMTIADERYATELITKKGKVYFFDSVECLAGFYLDQDPDDVASLWVTDFHTQARMIPVEEAFFLRSKDLRSPMGMNLTAFGDGIEPETVLNSFIGEVLDWAGVLALVETEGPPGREWRDARGPRGGIGGGRGSGKTRADPWSGGSVRPGRVSSGSSSFWPARLGASAAQDTLHVGPDRTVSTITELWPRRTRGIGWWCTPGSIGNRLWSSTRPVGVGGRGMAGSGWGRGAGDPQDRGGRRHGPRAWSSGMWV